LPSKHKALSSIPTTAKKKKDWQNCELGSKKYYKEWALQGLSHPDIGPVNGSNHFAGHLEIVKIKSKMFIL
jgi:hypothetical protein